ncbi:hypothetical protein [Alteromonas sediminis]|uniref:hypothetical protein n=1 Tax=Alteromonas sediminis TaxID=2259342 RepID=UPI00196B4EBC|nr:hypothetical protein [Alteromonas sediminis]
MLSKLLPWKYLMQRAAHHYGFIDPTSILARIRQFSQPSEVAEPIELLRAGVSFHARGLVNTKAIQTNLDWVWPYWVEKQFNPNDPSFVPRAFSISHVNLTHRDWTAVGVPDLALYPIVDPRGLVTPLYDGWSFDIWLQDSDGNLHFPSKSQSFKQKQHAQESLQVESHHETSKGTITSTVELVIDDNASPVLKTTIRSDIPDGGKIVIAFRPYNPEGIQFIERVNVNKVRKQVTVNNDTLVHFDRPADCHYFSKYLHGDVVSAIERDAASDDDFEVKCEAGMATAALGFNVKPNSGQQTLTVHIDLAKEMARDGHRSAKTAAWSELFAAAASLETPDKQLNKVFKSSLVTLALLSAKDIVPGPYTYKRFWFRDACLMMNALLAVNLPERVKRAFPGFLPHQKQNGYFQSQEGEWDSNGQVLWILDRYEQVTGDSVSDDLVSAARKAVKWIDKKRLDAPNTRHHGLFPAGFSAEHFGPNDHYYWDDYWAIGGLNGIAALFTRHDMEEDAETARHLSEQMKQSVEASIDKIETHKRQGGIPASPYRRMDSGAIGSMVSDYPLQLNLPDDPALVATTEFLLQKCFFEDTFFQDMIHSGKNIYLTLAVAQSLLRQGDDRYHTLIDAVVSAASPTGHWPEAIHPRSGGGCMGDGQHGWAAAEFLMMVRNMFIREEQECVIVGSGIPEKWLDQGDKVAFGPTLTPWGKMAVEITVEGDEKHISLDIDWHSNVKKPDIKITLPGYKPVNYDPQLKKATLTPLNDDMEANH